MTSYEKTSFIGSSESAQLLLEVQYIDLANGRDPEDQSFLPSNLSGGDQELCSLAQEDQDKRCGRKQPVFLPCPDSQVEQLECLKYFTYRMKKPSLLYCNI